jgi:hypothetical protein
MPQLINGLCTMLSPDVNAEEDRHREAMGNLKAVLLAEGGER